MSNNGNGSKSNEVGPLLQGSSLISPEEHNATVLARVAAMKAKGAVYVPFEGGIQFLGCDGNTGALSYGKDNNEIPDGQQFVVPIHACQHGVIKWEGGKPVARRMISCLEDVAPGVPAGEHHVGTLAKPYDRDGWNEVISIRLVGLGGELNRVDLEVDCNNQSKRQSAENLLGVMTAKCDTPTGQKGFFNAVVTLSVDSYWNKNYKKDVYFPVFNIVGWTDGNTIETVGKSDQAALAGEPGSELLD